MLTATLPLPFHDFNTEYYPVCVACTVECLRMSTVECLLFDMIIFLVNSNFEKFIDLASFCVALVYLKILLFEI